MAAAGDRVGDGGGPWLGGGGLGPIPSSKKGSPHHTICWYRHFGDELLHFPYTSSSTKKINRTPRDDAGPRKHITRWWHPLKQIQGVTQQVEPDKRDDHGAPQQLVVGMKGVEERPCRIEIKARGVEVEKRCPDDREVVGPGLHHLAVHLPPHAEAAPAGAGAERRRVASSSPAAERCIRAAVPSASRTRPRLAWAATVAFQDSAARRRIPSNTPRAAEPICSAEAAAAAVAPASWSASASGSVAADEGRRGGRGDSLLAWVGGGGIGFHRVKCLALESICSEDASDWIGSTGGYLEEVPAAKEVNKETIHNRGA
uniref:Uncharacterized protein n=1 Tax=Oryza glumipatula TaxID=40148 RepID=A0A0D9ZJE2_9ORYZ